MPAMVVTYTVLLARPALMEKRSRISRSSSGWKGGACNSGLARRLSIRAQMTRSFLLNSAPPLPTTKRPPVHFDSCKLIARRSATGVETFDFNFTTDKGSIDLATRENASSTSSIYELNDLVL